MLGTEKLVERYLALTQKDWLDRCPAARAVSSAKEEYSCAEAFEDSSHQEGRPWPYWL